MSAVLVVGESVLDIVESATGEVVAHAGGSPANVAVGLARLGQQATLVTELGPDEAGATMLAHLAAADVTTVVAPSSRSTPTARAVLQPDGSAHYDFDIDWTLGALGPLAGDHVHTGSIASHLEPGAAAVADLLRTMAPHATVSYDPNVRAALLGDHAQVVARTEAIVRLSHVVKASDEDLAWLYPGLGVEDALRGWAQAGPSLVVATMGAEGSLVCAGGQVAKVAPVTVDVVDTVGAGDSYMAALLDGLLRDGILGVDGAASLSQASAYRLMGAVERAARAAAITVSRAGANPPTAAELDHEG